MGFDSFNSHISLVEIWRSNQFCCTSLYAFRTGTTYICVGLIILIVAESITPSCRCHRPSSRMLSTSEKHSRQMLLHWRLEPGRPSLWYNMPPPLNWMETTTIVAGGSVNFLMWVGGEDVIMGEAVLLPPIVPVSAERISIEACLALHKYFLTNRWTLNRDLSKGRALKESDLGSLRI